MRAIWGRRLGHRQSRDGVVGMGVVVGAQKVHRRRCLAVCRILRVTHLRSGHVLMIPWNITCNFVFGVLCDTDSRAVEEDGC
jgi:hypothetical protein